MAQKTIYICKKTAQYKPTTDMKVIIEELLPGIFSKIN